MGRNLVHKSDISDLYSGGRGRLLFDTSDFSCPGLRVDLPPSPLLPGSVSFSGLFEELFLGLLSELLSAWLCAVVFALRCMQDGLPSSQAPSVLQYP